MFLKLPQGHEASEYVLSFETGQREGCFYSARTDIHADTPSTVLVYRFTKHVDILRLLTSLDIYHVPYMHHFFSSKI